MLQRWVKGWPSKMPWEMRSALLSVFWPACLFFILKALSKENPRILRATELLVVRLCQCTSVPGTETKRIKLEVNINSSLQMLFIHHCPLADGVPVSEKAKHTHGSRACFNQTSRRRYIMSLHDIWSGLLSISLWILVEVEVT